MAKFSSAADVFDEARSWQYRVVRASLATTTGLIVMAMLARQPRHGIAFGHTCDILLDGTVVTPMRRNGQWGDPGKVGDIVAVRDNVRRLADHCRLNDADRVALFCELSKWIRKDHRARSEA